MSGAMWIGLPPVGSASALLINVLQALKETQKHVTHNEPHAIAIAVATTAAVAAACFAGGVC